MVWTFFVLTSWLAWSEIWRINQRKKDTFFFYLICEEYPLSWMIFAGLHPWIAGEVDWTTCKSFNGYSLQKKLHLMLVAHCECSRHTKIRVHHKLSYVIDPFSFDIWFLWPVFNTASLLFFGALVSISHKNINRFSKTHNDINQRKKKG